MGVQSQQEGVEDDMEGRRPKRRSSNAGVHYSEDLSDAMFDRLLQPDDQPGSASEVTCPPSAQLCCAVLCCAVLCCAVLCSKRQGALQQHVL